MLNYNDPRAGARLAQLPLDAQLDELRRILETNNVLTDVLERARTLALPGWFVTAGAVVNTVWNVLAGRDPEEGIKDVDLFYADPDTSWNAEDAAIRAGHALFGDLAIPVEIRNECRVPLWYAERFGTPCPPFASAEDGIDHFAMTTSCVGIRLEDDGRWTVYAPHGLSDVFNLVVRPNPVLAPREVYEAKAERWRGQWPDLTVMPWPEVA